MEFDPVLVHDWLSRSARRTPDKTALITDQGRWTYADLDQQSSRLAFALKAGGLKRQDRVAVLMDNCAETVISLYGILKAGGVFVILSGSMKASKLRYILNNSGARCLITHTSKAKVVEEAWNAMHSNPPIIWVGVSHEVPDRLASSSTSWESRLSVCVDETIPSGLNGMHRQCIDIDLASLIYTSGSTGEPKGVMSTHHNIISAARSIIQYIGNEPKDVILNVLPLSFDYGLYQVIMAVMFGGTVVLEKSFLFLHRVLERIAEERVTGFPIVPTIAAMLLKMQDISQYDLRSLHYMTNTGAALPVDHIRRLNELFPHVTMISMFGLTECKRVSYLPPEQLQHRPGSVGRAMPNCEAYVVDDKGYPALPGKTGELVIRGSNVMQGYWNDPELTSRTYRAGAYPADRILYSGDHFRSDQEGFFYFLGRKDDMIKSKGERISAKEVENTIHEIKGVAEVAVVGIPDEILGQAIAAFIVLSRDTDLTERDVLRYCANTLESFMVPRIAQFVEELPKTPNGKIDKKQLKTMEASHYVS